MEIVSFAFHTENNQSFEIQVFGDSETLWFRGKDVTTAFDFSNSNDAIINHVDNDDKIRLRDALKCMGSKFATPSNFSSNELNTIFINESGLYSLIFGSKKPLAKIFKKWVISEVLPSIRKTGKYSIINSSTQVKQPLIKNEETLLLEEDSLLLQIKTTIDNFSSFVSTESLKDKNVVYMAYIGEYEIDNVFVHCFKFGKSSSSDNRMKSHKSTFDTFDLIYMKECKNNLFIENDIKSIIKNLGIGMELEIRDRKYTEIFYIENWAQLQNIMKDVDCSIILQHKDNDETKIKLQDKDLEIKDLKYELLKTKTDNEIKELKRRITEQDNRILELEKRVEELTKENSRLLEIIEEYKEKFERGQVVNNITINQTQAPVISPVISNQVSHPNVNHHIPSNASYEEYKRLNKLLKKIEACENLKQLKKLRPTEITEEIKGLDELKSAIKEHYENKINSLRDRMNTNCIPLLWKEEDGTYSYKNEDMKNIIKSLGGTGYSKSNNGELYKKLLELFKTGQEKLLAKVSTLTEDEVKTISELYCKNLNVDRNMLRNSILQEIERINILKQF